MDDQLKRIKQVERQSIENLKQARQDRDESVRTASSNANQRYEKEIQAHQATLLKDQEKGMEAFKENSKQVVENGKLEAEKVKQVSPQDFETAVKAAYELVIGG